MSSDTMHRKVSQRSVGASCGEVSEFCRHFGENIAHLAEGEGSKTVWRLLGRCLAQLDR